MMLSQADINLFYKLWHMLTWKINQKHKIVPQFKLPTLDEPLDEESLTTVRKKIWNHPRWIDEFLKDTGEDELTEEERKIVVDWRNHFLKGSYFAVKHLKNYTVFMSSVDSRKIYAVYGISYHIKDILDAKPPYVVDTVLLPFKGRVIYDGFLYSYDVKFGKSIKNDLEMMYRKTKDKIGIIRNLKEAPIPEKILTKSTSTAKTQVPFSKNKSIKIPKSMSERFKEIEEMLEQFCDEMTNNTYKDMCILALQNLCCIRPSPLVNGTTRTWACSIAFAIGSNNFEFDEVQPYTIDANDIIDWFGLSRNRVLSKAKEICQLLKFSNFNANFMLESSYESNPMIWYVSVRGHMVDIRQMPPIVQKEAYRKGLIPYIPGERGQDKYT